MQLAALSSALRSLLGGQQARLSKDAARAFAQDVEALRLSGELLELDDELARIFDVAKWCSRAPKRSWLIVRQLDAR